jgi:DNA-directed RNA polymerase specialized sigma54-like protein
MRTKQSKTSAAIQPTLFTLEDEERLSLQDVATELGVSTATIRNWIKTKYLQLDQAGFILRASVQEFQTNVAGVEKLTKRANKSHVDSHDHANLQTAIKAEIASETSDGCYKSTQ